jgi:dimethylargininase
MLMALTRALSPDLGNCELTFLSRERIDIARAAAQHEAYRARLESLGVRVLHLPAEAAMPDAVFVEDTAVVLDEFAVITRPGAASRQRETASIANALSRHRPLHFIQAPATLEGGDVLRVGRTLFVGQSTRTNREGIETLTRLLAPHGYHVLSVEVRGCLHLKTGCTFLGGNTLLLNRDWVSATAFAGFELLDVPKSEPFAANTLRIGDTILLPASVPRAHSMLESRGFAIQTLDIAELQKAEAGLSCLSLLFDIGPASALASQPLD